MVVSRVDDDGLAGFVGVENGAVALVAADGETYEDEGIFFEGVHTRGHRFVGWWFVAIFRWPYSVSFRQRRLEELTLEEGSWPFRWKR